MGANNAWYTTTIVGLVLLAAITSNTVSNSSGCEALWACDQAGSLGQSKLTSNYPGLCGQNSPGFVLGRSNRWSPKCALEFLAMIFDDCVASQVARQNETISVASKECINLTVAGSGSKRWCRQ